VARATAAPAPALEEGRARPNLSVVGPEPAPRLARSAAERIATQTGGSVELGEGGLRTVHFPSPTLMQTPITVSRELSEGGSAPASSTSETSAAAPAAEDGKSKDAEREELYEYFLDRFKRDLLAEREQSGYLIIDNP
jgi:hypothetical protein